MRRHERAGGRFRAAGTALLAASVLVSACGPGGPGGSGGVPERDGRVVGAEGGALYYQVLGNAPDTVVVVHGGPGAGIGSIRPAVEPLAGDFTLVMYDQRGGGRSVLPDDTALLHARYHVEDLEAVRRHFGLDRMNVLAHSFGSILVARYAQRYPGRLGRAVFHGATGPELMEAIRVARASPPPADSALAAQASQLIGSLLRGEADDPVGACREYEALSHRLTRLRGDSVHWEGTSCDAPPEAVGYYFRYTAQHSPRTFGAWDFTSGLEDLDAPLLAVTGSRDSLGLPGHRAWAAAVPDGRLLVVPGAGKGGLMARPDFTIPAIKRFFGGQWPEDAVRPE